MATKKRVLPAVVGVCSGCRRSLVRSRDWLVLSRVERGPLRRQGLARLHTQGMCETCYDESRRSRDCDVEVAYTGSWQRKGLIMVAVP